MKSIAKETVCMVSIQKTERFPTDMMRLFALRDQQSTSFLQPYIHTFSTLRFLLIAFNLASIDLLSYKVEYITYSPRN